jgi:hypothetical protein
VGEGVAVKASTSVLLLCLTGWDHRGGKKEGGKKCTC